jgi:hypothetical protein
MKNSPLNELTAQDIARKQKKLDRIDKRIERKDDKFKAKVSSGKKGTDMDITRHERSLSGLKERKHKTEHQIKTGERGRPTSLKNEAWLAGPSRKPSSPVNNLGFTMPHSPLNQNDSIAAVKAFKLDTENYMKREFKGNNPRLGPITPEQNAAEAKSEQSGKYYNIEEKRLKLIPTDDAEVQDVDFKNKLKKWQLPPLDRKSPLNQGHENPKHGSSYIETYPTATGKWGGKLPEWEANKVWSDSSSTWISNPKDVNLTRPQLERKSDSLRIDRLQKDFDKKWKSPLNQNEKVYNMTPNVSEKEAAGVREKFDRTYMKRGSHAHADSEFEKATYQLMNEGVIKETDNKSMPLIEKRMKENKRNK